MGVESSLFGLAKASAAAPLEQFSTPHLLQLDEFMMDRGIDMSV